MNDVRTVSYFSTYDEMTKELYRCEENGKIYCRQKVPGNDKQVRWLSTNKWRSGYEPDSPLKPGITIKVVDKRGQVVFEEVTKKTDDEEVSYAVKKHQFFSEEVKSIARREQKIRVLTEHNVFCKMICDKMQDYDYKGDRDTWFYGSCVEELSEAVVATYETLRGPVSVYAIKNRHKVTGQMFMEYILKDKKDETVFDICGYALIE